MFPEQNLLQKSNFEKPKTGTCQTNERCGMIFRSLPAAGASVLAHEPFADAGVAEHVGTGSQLHWSPEEQFAHCTSDSLG